MNPLHSARIIQLLAHLARACEEFPVAART